MFKFDFQLEDEGEPAPVAAPVASSSRPVRPCYAVTLDELLAELPDVISYSPISAAVPILRRDLFDARFQLATEDGGAGAGGDSGVAPPAQPGQAASVAPVPPGAPTDAPAARDDGGAYVDADTDLVPGVYEGGLKSWEGGVDLVDVLAAMPDLDARLAGSRVLEVGCGTALPSAYLLGRLLSATAPTTPAAPTTLHLADYNRPVLALVTLPNLLLAALPYLPAESLEHETEPDADALADADAGADANAHAHAHADAPLPADGSLALTPRLKAAFTALLRERQVELKFTYGDWTGLAGQVGPGQGYDVVLTAETIYEDASVDALVDVLAAAWRPGKEDTLVLVAAKVLYFGVGGDLDGFVRRVRAAGATVETVKEWTRGVGRKVVRLRW